MAKGSIYTDKRNEYAKEVSRKASMANKRLKRLEQKGMTDNPAYRRWLDYKDGQKFSVAGKDYNDLQKENARLNQFLSGKTSTIRGTNKVLKDMATNTGIKYEKVSDLQKASTQFFDLSSKVEQYLRVSQGSASAVGYKRIWKAINQYVEDEDLRLDRDLNIDLVLNDLINVLDNFQLTDTYEDIAFGSDNTDDWFRI